MGGKGAKVYRRHRCQRRHRTYRAFANCVWPRAEWILGEGPFALLAHCSVLTVTLHTTLESAENDKRMIDGGACGHACHGDHEIIELLLP
jgi:hypothetical protein